MTVRELRDILELLEDNVEVFVGDLAVSGEDAKPNVRNISSVFDFSDATRPSVYLLGSEDIGSGVFYQKVENLEGELE